MTEKIPEHHAKPIAEALEKHSGLTKGQIATCRDWLSQIALVRIVDKGECLLTGPVTEGRRAIVVQWKIPPESLTPNQKLLLPLLLEHATREFQPDRAKIQRAEHPQIVAERRKHVEAAEKEAAEKARVTDLVNQSSAALNGRIDELASKINLLVSKLLPAADSPLPLQSDKKEGAT